MQTESKTTKVFKVLFRGVILPGFDKEDVIKNVHAITRIPEAIITRKFFSGKTVVIRHADTQEYASRLQKTFAKAGIETYIEELVTEQQSDHVDDTEYDALKQEKKEEKKTSGKKGLIILLLVGAIIAIAGMGIFSNLFSHSEQYTDNAQKKAIHKKSPTVKKTELTINSQQSIQIQTDKASSEKKTTDTTQKSAPVLLFSQTDIIQFLKITQSNELSRLKQFLALFPLSENQQKAIIELLKLKPVISAQSPLYLFQTKNDFGLYLSLQPSEPELTDIKNLLTIKNKCVPFKTLSLKQHKNHYLLSTFNSDIENFYPALDKSLQSIETVFSTNQFPIEAAFYLYMNSSAVPELKLIASKKQFIFMAEESLKYKNIENISGIHFNSLQKLNNKVQDLWDILLLSISLNTDHDFTTQHKFIPQISSPFKASSQLSPYQTQLDLEFQPQWTGGPFALSTSSFIFEENHPVIELLAKGQNINSFIEYTAMAQLTTTEVLTADQKNVLLYNCATANTRTDTTTRLFKNTDGEQEAFINDDFVSFQTITARDKLKLTAGTRISDILEVRGEIKLYYPQHILEQELTLSKTSGIFYFEDFIFLYNISQNKNTQNSIQENTLEYQILGNTPQFVSLRIYDQTGNIINTTDFQYQSHLNDSIRQFKRVFTKPVNLQNIKLKIFYSPEYKQLDYPFIIQPEIEATQTLIEPLSDKQAVSPEQNQVNINTLNKPVSSDNPQWLGEKLASIITKPFYISLFKQQANEQAIADATLNIKLASTPLLHRNLSSAKLKIIQADIDSNSKNTLYNNFIHFNFKTLNTIKQDYLNSNIAIQMNTQDTKLQGEIDLFLPREFNTQEADFKAPGKTLKTASIQITFIRQTSRTLEFSVSGDLKTLVQLKIYNKDKALISDLIDYKQLDATHARLQLIYYGKPDSIKLISGKNFLSKQYPFEL